jgi:uncharacterized protein (TIGR01777 family)
MKIAIAGGTGFIGKHLGSYLSKQGHEIIIVSRSGGRLVNGLPVISWSELETEPRELDAIVNLAGASINKKWSPAYKREILQSRLEAAERISNLVEIMERKPQVVVNSSGISIYGNSDTEEFDERSKTSGIGFLEEVAIEWEKAADRIRHTRVVKLRTGIVLATDGGALPLMLLPFKLFTGGRVGRGKQWLSWIHINDICRLIEFCILNPKINGPVNAVSPHAVTNEVFSQTVARALSRPNWFPVPAFLLKIIFGEMSTLLLDGQKVLPTVALENGFQFNYSRLNEALKALLKN